MRTLITIVCFLAMHVANAQLKLQYSEDGKLLTPLGSRIKMENEVDIVITSSLGNSITYIFKKDPSLNPAGYNYYTSQSVMVSPASNKGSQGMLLSNVVLFRTMKRQFAEKVTNTLNNLDEQEALQNFYKTLWTESKYNETIKQLKALKKALKDRDDVLITASTPGYFSDVYDFFRGLLAKTTRYDVTVSYLPKQNRYNIEVVKQDLFRDWLLSQLGTLANTNPFTFYEADRQYKSDWAQLIKMLAGPSYASMMEQLKKDYNFSHDHIIICNDKMDDERKRINTMERTISEYYDVLNHNRIFKSVTANDSMDVYKKMLWYDGGNYSTNPLLVTSNDRIFRAPVYDIDKASKHDAFILEKIQKADSCLCGTSVGAYDSLLAMQGSGKNKFGIPVNTKDTAWNINTLDDLENTSKLVNRVKLPVTLGNETPQVLIHYYATDDFATGDYLKKKWNRIYSETDSVTVCVHNVTLNSALDFNQQANEIPKKDSGFLSFASMIPGIASVFTGSLAPALINLLANTPATHVSNAIITPPRSGMGQGFVPDALAINSLRDVKAKKEANQVMEEYEKSMRNRPHILNITFDNGQNWTLPLTKKITIREILIDFFKEHNAGVEDSGMYHFLNCIKDPSLDASYPTEINIATVEEKVHQLLNEYYAFVKFNQDRATRLNIIKQKIDIIQSYTYLASVTDRSLPENNLVASSDTFAVYHTELLPLSIPDASKNIVYAATLKKKNDKDSIVASLVIKDSINIGKKQRFQLSVGVGVTLRDYYKKTASFSNNQLSVASNSDVVTAIAGVHYYIWKINPLDNSFLGIRTHTVKNHLSLYVGLGLSEILKQYYPGVGIDIVPGFKIVAGAHLFLNTKYQLVNNQVTDQASSVKYAGPFISVGIDVSVFNKIIALFK